jgi:CheY-like chemotaxis protein
MKKPEVAAPAQAFRILLIDDNRNGQLVRKSILEEQGYLVTALSSTQEALSALRSTDFELVITDYKMPRIKDGDVVRLIREAKPSIPLIVISGLVDALGLNEKNTGADCVIPKSSTEQSHLVRAVNRLLHPSAPRKPASSQSPKRAAKRAGH